jgi:hypothetical protein
MHRITRFLNLLISSLGFITIILTGTCLADSISMQLSPANPKLTYRLTADNKIILPDPIQIRLSRVDQDPFCTRIKEVGVYASTALELNNMPPGYSDLRGKIFTSPISGGAALCNFNFNDNLINFQMEKGITERFEEWKNPMVENYYQKRRTQQILGFGMTSHPTIDFKVYAKKNDGAYQWINPSFSSNTVTPYFWNEFGVTVYHIPFEAIIDPIPNTPPQIQKLTIFPATLPVDGGSIKISLIAADDLGVKSAKVTNSFGNYTFSLVKDETPLGKTADGRVISLWEGTCQHNFPNRSIYKRNITFTLKVSDEEGLLSNPAGEIRQVEQAGMVDSEAPKIENVAINPTTFPSTGGNITVKVNASDNLGGITLVRLDLILPDGQIRPMNMPFVSGDCYQNGPCMKGEWRLSWNMWVNTTSTKAVYGVKVTAVDVSKNTISSQVFPVEVAGVPRPSIQSIPSGQTAPTSPQGPAVPSVPVPIR